MLEFPEGQEQPGLARLHSRACVDADRRGVEIGILGDVLDQAGKIVGLPHPVGIEDHAVDDQHRRRRTNAAPLDRPGCFWPSRKFQHWLNVASNQFWTRCGE